VDAVKPDIVYEDNHLLVCVKPFNVPSQADQSGDPDMLTLLKAYIKENKQKPGNVFLGLVHRLDRPAGGLMVFAKTSKAASRLFEQMQSDEFEKRYLIRTLCVPEQRVGEWTDYLKKEQGNRVRIAQQDDDDAKFSKLRYKVKKEDKDGTALIEVNLITGRSHQIRVQFASRGCPVVGDARYGKGGTQLRLWSAHLGFLHPTKGDRMAFDAPLPPGF
jgi:23S rRNA pseudouridine1911/1915/1917 synthase